MRTENRNRSIVEASQDAIIAVDRDAIVTQFNPAAERIFGYDRQEALGAHLDDLIVPEEYRDAHNTGFKRLRESREATTMADKLTEAEALRADGTRIAVEIQISPLIGEGEDFCMAAIRDITKRKKMENILREKEERVRLLLDSTAEAIYGINLEENCTFCNPACIKMLGYEHEKELLGQNMHALIHHTRPDGTPYPVEECLIYKTFKQGQGTHVDDEVLWRKDGASFMAEYWSYPIYHDETLIGFVVTFLDITERKEAERERLRTQKMDSLGSLAGGIAHDINNMLLPILTLTPMVSKGLPEESSEREKLDMVIQAAQRMKDMAAKILAFSREDEDEFSEIDIYKTVVEAMDILHSTMPSTIKISYNLTPKTGKVLADPKRLEAILMNLGSNARDAMKGKPGEFIVSLSPMTVDEELSEKVPGLMIGRYAKLMVSDTGCGMDEETMQHIYEPLFTTKEKCEGTGLGMSMIFGTVSKYNGAISVSSELGKGTSFDIYIPLVNQEK